MHGLGKNLELVALCARFLKQIGGGGLPGEEQDLNAGQKGSNLDGGVDSIESGDDESGDEQSGRRRCGDFESDIARRNRASLEAALVQNHRQRIGNDAFIVNNQDLGFCVIFGHTLIADRNGAKLAFARDAWPMAAHAVRSAW